jgi:hypothetical protein
MNFGKFWKTLQQEGTGTMNDTTDEPRLLFAKLEEKTYQSELALLDRYHTFSAELLRIALIGLGAFGFILKETFSKIDWAQASCLLASSKVFAVISVGMFGLSAACALAHRFASTEGVRFFFYGLRLNTMSGYYQTSGKRPADEASERDRWLKRRERYLTFSSALKAAAATTLVLASLALTTTFVILLLEKWPLLPTK